MEMAAAPGAVGLRVAVLVKHVPVDATDLRPSPGGVARGDVAHGLDPIDEVGLEWAVRGRAGGQVESVVAISMGPPGAADSLRRALACGADETLLVTDPALAGADVRRTAQVLSAAVRRAGADLAVFGYESLDGSSGVVPSAVASACGWPLVSRVADAIWTRAGALEAERDAGRGAHRVRVTPPVVLSFVAGRIEPSYPSMRAALRTRRATVPEAGLAELGVSLLDRPAEQVVRVEDVDGPARQQRRVAEAVGAEAIVDVLAQHGLLP